MPKIALRIAVPVPVRQLFDYLPPSLCNLTNLSPGMRVRVPFQKKTIVGIYIGQTQEPDFAWEKLKPAIEILDSESIIPSDIWQLCLWAADYYQYPLGEVLIGALPVLLRQGKPAKLNKEAYWQLTEQGASVPIDSLKRAPRQVALLHLLAQHPEGLTAKELRAHEIPKTIISSVAKKGWIIARSELFTPNQHTAQQPLDLNASQQEAVKTIRHAANTFQVMLLDGITGSGKTEVYLQAMTDFLNQQKQVLVLVPEIGLTPQTIQRFRERFAVAVVGLHSGLSEKERLNAWLAAKSGAAKIIIGTRSAIFTPFADLGLIIVDEEHDLSFKQQDSFRYHARDLAIMRAHFNKIPIVLGSATPSLETLHKVQQGRYQHLQLPQRAGVAQLPEIRILDICKAPLEQGISPQLFAEITIHLNQGDQVMLFLNRRGFAPILMCHACGWMAKCKRCDMRMTYHQQPERLHCHHCDSRRGVFKRCESCGEKELNAIGLGTERLEDALSKHFPQVSIARIDRDNTQRKGSLEDLLEKIQCGEHRILIGTQMLAKGHHFPNVTLVAIIDADGGFFSTDFRALERMGQLLLQVSGRAGRAEKPGKVIIQTHHPDHPLLHQLLRQSYHHFALTLLKEREQAQLPPYFFFALFRAEAYDLDHAFTFLQQIKNAKDISGKSVRMLGPIPAPMPRRAGRHRVQLLIQAAHRPVLQNFLKNLLPEIDKIPSKHRVHWSLDVDPLEMY
ncbi:MAG: primosomal protein N' [Gammaproteobacteria bacterium]